MTLNLSSSRIVIVIRSSHRSLRRWIPSGRSAYDGSKSGHFNLATTQSKNDHQHYVKFEEHPSKHVFSRRKQISIAPNAQFRKADCICALIVLGLRENLDAMSDTDTSARYQRSIPVRHLRIGHARVGRGT
ncbi:hypothetical protein [Burkholderia cepacia]|uniref:hypothetical protein n=1 Tax=Burkholderia cepacia TaxID=292 RepID=UPI0012BC8F65|nr:hypothetical protein [Burkholderia cepacia]MDN7762419.1 hypothetical protein [Burkholderia cepacia]